MNICVLQLSKANVVMLHNKLNTYPDVTLAREIAFRDSGGVQPSTSDIHGTHQIKPAHLANRGGLNKALLNGEVHGGNNAAKSQTHKNTLKKRMDLASKSTFLYINIKILIKIKTVAYV